MEIVWCLWIFNRYISNHEEGRFCSFSFRCWHLFEKQVLSFLFEKQVFSLCAFPVFCLSVYCMFFFKICTPACISYVKCSTAGMRGDKHLPIGASPGQQSKQRLLQVRIPQQLGGTQMSHTSQNPLPCRWLAPTTTSRKQPTLPREREEQTLKQHNKCKEKGSSVL